MSAAKINPRDKVVESLIEKLENNPGSWQKTWQNIATSRPVNPLSGTQYRGVNLINLAITSSEFFSGDPRWATYKQAADAGFPVKHGSKSEASAIFHKLAPQLQFPDGNSISIKATNPNAQVKEIKSLVQENMPSVYSSIKNINDINDLKDKLNTSSSFKVWNKAVITSAALFNFQQLENAPRLEVKEPPSQNWQDYERAESLLKSTNYPIYHDQLSRNFYLPGKNEIHLTPKASFNSPEAYYATALHECAHAKLHDKTIPLDYDQSKYGINDRVRAKEELRAEISSVLICAELGMNYNVQNHANYVNSWIKCLKEDKTELWNAVADSNKVADAILAFKPQEQILDKPHEEKLEQKTELETENHSLAQNNVHEIEQEVKHNIQEVKEVNDEKIDELELD